MGLRPPTDLNPISNKHGLSSDLSPLQHTTQKSPIRLALTKDSFHPLDLPLGQRVSPRRLFLSLRMSILRPKPITTMRPLSQPACSNRSLPSPPPRLFPAQRLPRLSGSRICSEGGVRFSSSYGTHSTAISGGGAVPEAEGGSMAIYWDFD